MIKELRIDAMYAGKYVALKSRKEEIVVSSGDNPKKVLEEARKNNIENPVIVFIPQTDSVYVY